jgi:hypothetical protein
MKHLCTLVLAIFAALLLSTPAKGSPAGILNVGSCPGGGVNISNLVIDWTLPVGGGNGCTETSVGTNVTYTGGGPLVQGVTGTIKDLTSPSLLDFMTFAGNPNLHFDLTSVGPGSGNANCVGLLLGQSCSPTASHPFILTLTASGTSISLNVSGIARDLSAGSSTWVGAFTTQIAGQTPLQIQQILNGGGTISSTYSGTFTVTGASQVPEPTTMLLLGTGLAGIVVKVRKRRKAV